MQINYVDYDIGSHIPFEGTIFLTLADGIEKGMMACQFFMGNPKSPKRTRIDPKDLVKCKKILARFPMHVFSHFPYTASLCGSVDSLAWKEDKIQNAKTEFVLRELEYEISILSHFRGNSRSGVVIHPGSYRDRLAGLSTIAKSINKMTFTKGGMLLLENCAGEGTKLCRNFGEIREIFDQIEPNKQDNVGVCIDTAHIWGQGDYDISKTIFIDRLFDDFDRILGLDKFVLLHLNDSEVPLGSKKDRHARVGTGHIWGKSTESLVYLVGMCKKHKIPMVLETVPEDMECMARICC